MKTRNITGYAMSTRRFGDTVKQMEYAYAALSAFFPRAEVGTVEVLFMPVEDRIEAFGTDRGPIVFAGVPGGGSIGQRNLVVMSEDQGYTLSALMLSHLFLDKAVPGAPMWLHDGMSRYLGRLRIQSGDGQWRACFGYQAPLDARYKQMPFDRFFAVTWQTYAESEPTYYRGTAALLMDFIFHGDSGAHLGKLPAIFAAASQGQSGPQILAATFPGVSLEQLAARISDFKGSQKEQRERSWFCPIPIPLKPDRLPDESGFQEAPVAPEEIAKVVTALKRLPHGARFPEWYPREVIAETSAAGH